VQWVLCYKLACTLQQRQSSSSSSSGKSQRQQQQQQQQQQGSDFAGQLIAALGVPAAWHASSYSGSSRHSRVLTLPADRSVAALADALLTHLLFAEQTMLRFGGSQQQPKVWPLVPAELAMPLPLAVLELSVQLLPQLSTSVTSLTFMGCLHYLIPSYTWYVKHSGVIALKAMQAHVEAQPAGAQSLTTHIENPDTEVYQEAVLELVQPLLHRLGPAVLKAVRKLEQGQGSAQAGSSSSSSQAVRPAAQKGPAEIADDGIGAYGAVLLQVVCGGETAGNSKLVKRLDMRGCYMLLYDAGVATASPVPAVLNQ
jgi:hypothetical protein